MTSHWTLTIDSHPASAPGTEHNKPFQSTMRDGVTETRPLMEHNASNDILHIHSEYRCMILCLLSIVIIAVIRFVFHYTDHIQFIPIQLTIGISIQPFQLMDLLQIEWTNLTTCDWRFQDPRVHPLSEQETSQMLRTLSSRNITISWLGDSVFRRNALTLRDWLEVTRDPNADRKCNGPDHDNCVWCHCTLQWDIGEDIHFRSLWTPQLQNVSDALRTLHSHLGQQSHSTNHIIIVGAGVHDYGSVSTENITTDFEYEHRVYQFVEQQFSMIRSYVDANYTDSFRFIFRTQAALLQGDSALIKWMQSNEQSQVWMQSNDRAQVWNRVLIKVATKYSFPVFDAWHWSTGSRILFNGRHPCNPHADGPIHMKEKARMIMMQQILNAVRILYL